MAGNSGIAWLFVEVRGRRLSFGPSKELLLIFVFSLTELSSSLMELSSSLKERFSATTSLLSTGD